MTLPIQVIVPTQIDIDIPLKDIGLIPLISVFRRVAYVFDLGVDGWMGVQNWMGGIEFGWVDRGGQIHAGVEGWTGGYRGGRVDGWLFRQGWMGGYRGGRVDGWLQGWKGGCRGGWVAEWVDGWKSV